MPDKKPSMKDVIAGQTRICNLNEKSQKISYCGIDLGILAGKVSFEEVAWLLLVGHKQYLKRYDHDSGFEKFLQDLKKSWRKFDHKKFWENIDLAIRACPREAHAMDILRQAIGAFGTHDERKDCQRETEDREIATDLIGNFGYFVGLVYRYKSSLEPLLIIPVDKGSLAANVFYMLGKKPTELEVDIMDLLFTLYAEHEFNASTFGVRSAATVGTDIYSGIAIGLSDLKGVLHGGANETASRFILGCARLENKLEEFLIAEVGKALRKEIEWKMPGFGHAVYRNGDARVPILKEYVRAFAVQKRNKALFDLCESVENAMLKARDIYLKDYPNFTWWFPNVDFWSAPAYQLMEIPLYLNTPLFAASRIVGWCAHWIEAKHELKEKIIRPRAEYIGD